MILCCTTANRNWINYSWQHFNMKKQRNSLLFHSLASLASAYSLMYCTAQKKTFSKKCLLFIFISWLDHHTTVCLLEIQNAFILLTFIALCQNVTVWGSDFRIIAEMSRTYEHPTQVAYAPALITEPLFLVAWPHITPF